MDNAIHVATLLGLFKEFSRYKQKITIVSGKYVITIITENILANIFASLNNEKLKITFQISVF